MHAGMIRHRVDGGHQASASAIRTMALGGRQLKLGLHQSNGSLELKKRFQSGAEMGSFSIEKEKYEKSARCQGDPGCLRIKWEGKEWLTEGILIATELAGFAHPGGNVPPRHRLHRSTIPSPLCKPNAEMGQCCRNII